MQKKLQAVYVGIDVSKNKLDIHLLPINKRVQITNSSNAIKKFSKTLLLEYPNSIELIVTEVTGGYEEDVLNILSHNFKTHRAHPNKIKSFIGALGIKAKTDRIDALAIAKYASFVQKAIPYEELPDSTKKLKAFSSRKEDIKAMIQAEKCRFAQSKDHQIKSSIGSHIKSLEKELKTINKEMSLIIKADDNLNYLYVILNSLKGIGAGTATVIIAELPEIGSLNKREIAALIGVAPYNNDSGNFKGKRSVRGGRKNIRNMLYMAAVSAMTHNKIMKAHYQKLVEKGKPKKVAIVAVMRKMIITLNTMVKNNEKWKFA